MERNGTNGYNLCMTTAAASQPEWLSDRVRINVQLLKKLRGMSDEALAKTGGFSSRQLISNRLTGRTELTAEDFARFAAGLKVEPHVLMLPQQDVFGWIEEHPDYKAPRYKRQPKNPNKDHLRRDA
jgi:transcriptional regulator with XRE-family HTH domain